MLLCRVVLLLCSSIGPVALPAQTGGAAAGAIAAAKDAGAPTKATASQTSNAPGHRITYELVSIHKSKPDAQGYDLNNTPEGIHARAINLRDLISEAYGFTFGDLLKEQIVGLPAWGESQRFDIHAKVDDSDVERLKAIRKAATMAVTVNAMVQRKPTEEMLMFQQMLEEHFHVKVHYEQRAMPVYMLTVAKGGLKMKPSAVKDPEHGSLGQSNGKLTGENVPPDFMTFLLTREVGRPVVNRTELPGRYDFEMKYAPESMKIAQPGEDTGPSIFTALDEQLGLKLVPGKELVWVVVVDRAEMPTVE